MGLKYLYQLAKNQLPVFLANLGKCLFLQGKFQKLSIPKKLTKFDVMRSGFLVLYCSTVFSHTFAKTRMYGN